MKNDLKRITLENNELFKENRDMKEQIRILNENLKRETEILLSRDRENNTLMSENKMLKERLDEYKSDSGQLKDEQGRLIENLRVQLNETRDRLNEMKEEKGREFKKVKERFEDQRRREAD